MRLDVAEPIRYAAVLNGKIASPALPSNMQIWANFWQTSPTYIEVKRSGKKRIGHVDAEHILSCYALTSDNYIGGKGYFVSIRFRLTVFRSDDNVPPLAVFKKCQRNVDERRPVAWGQNLCLCSAAKSTDRSNDF